MTQKNLQSWKKTLIVLFTVYLLLILGLLLKLFIEKLLPHRQPAEFVWFIAGFDILLSSLILIMIWFKMEVGISARLRQSLLVVFLGLPGKLLWFPILNERKRFFTRKRGEPYKPVNPDSSLP